MLELGQAHVHLLAEISNYSFWQYQDALIEQSPGVHPGYIFLLDSLL